MKHRSSRVAVGLLAVVGLSALGCSGATDPISPQSPSLVAGDFDATEFSRSAGNKVRIKYVVGNNVIDDYDFTAEEFDDGSVQGRFTVRETRFDAADKKGTKVVVKFKGKVTCLAVVGTRARLGGIVTKSNFKDGIPVGSFVAWSVSDNGKEKRQDSASPLLGVADPSGYCKLGLAFPEKQIGRGQIKIDPDKP